MREYETGIGHQYRLKELYATLTPKENEIFKYVKSGSLDKVMSCAVCGMCG